jgi:hypothetical protein
VSPHEVDFRKTGADPHLLLQRLEVAALLFVEAHVTRMYEIAGVIAVVIRELFDVGGLGLVLWDGDKEILEEEFLTRIVDGGPCCHTIVGTRTRSESRGWGLYMTRRVIVPRGMHLPNALFLTTATRIFPEPAPMVG